MIHNRTLYMWASSTSSYLRMVPGAVLCLLIMCAVSSSQTPGTPIEYHIDEELPARSMVGNVTRSAGLTLRYNTSTIDKMRFSLAEQRSNNWDFFAIDDRGILRTTEVIDRDKICAQEDVCAVNLRIIVQPVRYFQVIKVTVHIDDRNDNPPSFPQETIQRSFSETASPGTFFYLPKAEDLDSGTNGITAYNLNPLDGHFELKSVEAVDGSTDLHLVLRERLDRETEDSYTMWVTAVDGGQPQRTGSMLVQVKVTDANDNHPTFDNDTYQVMVPENIPLDTTIIKVHATDPDEGVNGQVVYGLVPATLETLGHVFGINEETGEIFVKGEIDYETAGVYQLSVFAKDKGQNSLPAYTRVLVSVEDLNDHAPVITLNTLTPNGNAQVVEGSQPGLFVAHVLVEDPDGGEIRCLLESDHFALQELYNVGEYKIITKTVFDRETKWEYHVNLVCHDKGQPPLTSTRHITVTVTDGNDHTPLFPQSEYNLDIAENNHQGAFIIKLNATDEDEGRNSAVVYEVLNADGILSVDRISGVVTADIVFDHEMSAEYKFLLVAIDQGDPPRSSSASLTISVLDLNDEAPVFSQPTYAFSVLENQPANTQVGQVFASDADSPPYNKCLYTFDDRRSLSQGIFSIDAQNGILVTKKELDRELKEEYHLVVTAFNKGFPNVSTYINVTISVLDVNDNAPVIVFTARNNTYNGTIEISNQVPKGEVIGYVGAVDVDVGANAQLSFGILNQTDELFKVDTTSGDISVAVDLEGFDFHVSTLTVEVKDQGDPQLTSTEPLHIVVNHSVFFIPLPSEQSFWSAKTFFAVGVGVACFLIVLFILMAVIIVKRRRTERNKKHTYNCRLEAEKTKSTMMGGALTSSSKHGRHNTSFESDLREPEKINLNGVELGESCTEDGWSKHQESECILVKGQGKGDPTHDKKRDSGIEVKADVVSMTTPTADLVTTTQRHQVPPQQHPPAYSGLPPATAPLREMELQVQDMLHLMLREKESPSETGSYTDSGKGPSEEGDHSHNWQDCHSDTLKGLPTVAEAHVLAMTEGQHVPETDQSQNETINLYSALPSVSATDGMADSFLPCDDEEIYLASTSERGGYVSHNNLHTGPGSYRHGRSSRPAPPCPSPGRRPDDPGYCTSHRPGGYHQPPSPRDHRLVRFASYSSPSEKSNASQAVTRNLSDTVSRSDIKNCGEGAYESQDYILPAEYPHVMETGEDTCDEPGCLRKWRNHPSLSDDLQRVNPYELYECQTNDCDRSIYKHVENPTSTRSKGVEDETNSVNNNSGLPKNKHKTRLQRTKAERVASKSRSKPKVQFWDEGQVNKCVQDVVAKYVPDKLNSDSTLCRDHDSLDGASDDGATSTSGSYIVDSDDFLRDVNVDSAEQMYVDFIIV